MEERLVDLDALVLRCRDDQAREYIAEAIACYRAGAFRSCIVATWIAVVYDFMDKLRELELTGDKKAREALEEFEEIQKQHDVKRALEFERQVIEMAKDDFELISPLEYIDLIRLQDDRNRCAHPSMNSFEEIYQPTAELARCHLRNAVVHMLQRPPVQGKAALDRLVRQVSSEYFPQTLDAAMRSFETGPLVRPRESLVRNFIIVLMKELLLGNLDENGEQRYATALNAVRGMHRSVTEKTFAEKLSDVMRRMDDEQLLRAIKFLHAIPDIWQFLEDDICAVLENYAESLPAEDLVPGLLYALHLPPLREKASTALHGVTAEQLYDLIRADHRDSREEFVDQAVNLYIGAYSFQNANFVGTHLIIPLARHLKPHHVERIIKAAAENEEIAHSFERDRALRTIRGLKQIPCERFDELVARCGIVLQREEEIPF